jgi:hypothetical protein
MLNQSPFFVLLGFFQIRYLLCRIVQGPFLCWCTSSVRCPGRIFFHLHFTTRHLSSAQENMSGVTDAPPMEPPDTEPNVPTDEQVIESWLKTKYLDYPYHGTTLSICIKELLRYTSTRLTDPANAWLSEDQITLPVALTVDNKARTDILVIESHAAAHLASVGLGLVTPEDFAATHSGMYAGMKDENVNWIIVPCNDGMTRQAEVDLAARKRAEQPVEPVTSFNDTDPVGRGGANWNRRNKKNNDYGTGSSQGMHWGVMIIDKAKNEARWLDGALRPERKNGKVYVGVMFPAARVAGKVLCGYDRVMNLPRGQFTATTLKHVPNDHGDNGFKGDAGCACGPWVIAIIQYILNNDSFLTAEHGLKETFASNMKAHHAQTMAFNSRTTRMAMNRMVQDEIYGQEPNLMPYRLTAQVARILDVSNPDGLPIQVRNLLNKGRAPQSGKSHRRDRDDSNDDGDDDDDDEGGNFEDTDVEKSTLMDIVRKNPSAYSHLKSKKEKMRQALENQRELQRSFEAQAVKKNADNADPYGTGLHSKKPQLRYPEGFDKDKLPDFGKLTSTEAGIWENLYLKDLFNTPAHVKPTYRTINSVMLRTYKHTFSHESIKSLQEEFYNDRFAFSPVEQSENWSAKAIAERLDETYFKLDIPFFAALSEQNVAFWIDRLPTIVRDILLKSDGSIDHGRARGMLYRMYVKELGDMSADEITAWRQADPSIPIGYEQDNESAMIAMKILYEASDAKHLPWLVNSPLHWPLRENRINHGSGKRKRGMEEERGGGDRDEVEDPTTTNPKPAKEPKITDGPETPITYPPAADPPPAEDPKTINWLNITDVNLAKYITPEIRADPRVNTNANNYTYRAILFLQHGGTFKDDSPDLPMDTWIRDTNVFKHGLDEKDDTIDLMLDRDLDLLYPNVERNGILQRMATHYQPHHAPSAPEVHKPIRPEPAKPAASERAKSTGVRIPFASLPTYTINFARMTIAEIEGWVAKRPVGDSLAPGQPHWVQRAILQHIFGGIDGLTDADIKTWKSRDPNFKKGKWSVDRVRKALKERVASVPGKDLRGNIIYYSDEWMGKHM